MQSCHMLLVVLETIDSSVFTGTQQEVCTVGLNNTSQEVWE